MDGSHISYTIEVVCKDLGINYKSNNPALKNRDIIRDAGRLRDIYLELKVVMGKLEEIAEKYNLPIPEDLKKLDLVDHHIIKLAFKLKK